MPLQPNGIRRVLTMHALSRGAKDRGDRSPVLKGRQMAKIITNLIQKFEEGKMNRRELVRNLTIAAGAAAGAVPLAAAGTGFTATGVHHLSFTVPDYAKTRDFYADLLNLKVSGDDGKSRCVLIGGDLHMNVRNGSATPLIDHFGIGIDNWNKDAVSAELKRRGLDPKTGNETSFSIKDPNGYRIQLDKKR
jgi:catechol 2,3-dioxygenase-like lactoylglutathione lyase family enzyme